LGRHPRGNAARRSGGCGLRCAGDQGAQHVALGYAAVAAGAGDAGRRQVVVGQQLGSRGHGNVALVGAGSGGGRRRSGGCCGGGRC
jgi:hypothetical protein